MTSFENAAELKRHFQLHSSQLYDTSLQSWVGGRSFKGHSYNSPCSKMAMDITFARVLRTTLPPTRQCKVVKLTPLRSVPHEKGRGKREGTKGGQKKEGKKGKGKKGAESIYHSLCSCDCVVRSARISVSRQDEICV